MCQNSLAWVNTPEESEGHLKSSRWSLMRNHSNTECHAGIKELGIFSNSITHFGEDGKREARQSKAPSHVWTVLDEIVNTSSESALHIRNMIMGLKV